MLMEKNRTLPIQDYVNLLGRQAKNAAAQAIGLTTAQKNSCLSTLAQYLEQAKAEILDRNQKDLAQAKAKKISDALLDRLLLTDDRFQAMVDAIHTVISLPDPIGSIDNMARQPSGIRVGKMRVPVGVVAMIYESRPNVTIDAAILNIKVGNAVILRGGSEAIQTNLALFKQLQRALIDAAGVPEHLVQLVEQTDRAVVPHLVTMNDCVDLVIPRGGKGLIAKVCEISSINVLKHMDGNCHVYIDDEADIQMADAIAWNAKTRRYGVCNAMETLLVAESQASEILPSLFNRLVAHGVELRLCSKSMEFASNIKKARPATDSDWYTEYLGPTLSVKIVSDVEEAISHINHYGSHHTDAIVTNNLQHAETFLLRVDSSSVMVNASTAFGDGGEYGLGAEIGISTDKFHARGPVGLEGLTTQKYVVLGQGETRA